jgi:flagellar biosynthesis protein FliR
VSAAPLLVFARCAGFVSRAPGFSHPSVPHVLRAGLALALTVAVIPGIHVRAFDGIALIVALVTEFALGTAIGMAGSLLYDGAYAGGRMLDDYVGVKAIAPNVDLVAPSGFGRIWSIAFTGGYFLVGAYRPAVATFAASFERILPGAPFDAHAWGPFAISVATTIVTVALAVAAPAIAVAFVTQIALAALARTVPRFATFTLSFPLVFGAVLIVTALSIPLAVAPSVGEPGALLSRLEAWPIFLELGAGDALAGLASM